MESCYHSGMLTHTIKNPLTSVLLLNSIKGERVGGEEKEIKNTHKSKEAILINKIQSQCNQYI